MYNRHECGVHPREPIVSAADAVFAHVHLLRDHLTQLEGRLQELKAGCEWERAKRTKSGERGREANWEENQIWEER